MNIEDFKKDLQHLINKHSIENGSNTPDFILADYLCTCLQAFDAAQNARGKWYGEIKEAWNGETYDPR